MMSNRAKALRLLGLIADEVVAIRESCIHNLVEPGNEDDTLQFIIERCTKLLDDGYVFDYDREYDKYHDQD